MHRSNGSRRPASRPFRAVIAGLALACAMASCRASARPLNAPSAVPTDPARALRAEGDAARRDGRTDEAVELFERAIAADPSALTSHVRLVETLVSAGRRSVALDRYARRAAAADATQIERVMAARLATDGSLAAVRRVYVAAAKRAPGDPWWRLALAEVDLAAAERALVARAEARAAGDRPRVAAFDDRVRRALVRAQSAVEHAAERDSSIPEISLYRGLVRSLEGDLLPGTVGARGGVPGRRRGVPPRDRRGARSRRGVGRSRRRERSRGRSGRVDPRLAGRRAARAPRRRSA